jgi:hypothetical protein
MVCAGGCIGTLGVVVAGGVSSEAATSAGKIALALCLYVRCDVFYSVSSLHQLALCHVG